MKLGFGLYRHMLDDAHFAFARQCGATHIVVHMCDYFRGSDQTARADQPVGDGSGWGIAEGRIWSVEELVAVRDAMAAHGLTFYAIENFDPGLWSDVLFDGPRRDPQMAGLQQLIRNVGAAGIAVFGYNFSLAGVAGRVTGDWARGGAPSVGLDGRNAVTESPMPASMAWNMVVDPAATGLRPAVTRDELWGRYAWFLDRILPVAREAGVRMAAHPDDPPLETVRTQPRLVYQPHLYQRLLDLDPSPAHALEFCVGTVAEMTEGDVYESLERHARQGRIAYVHLRNVRGRVPHYRETFIDEGDVDVARVIGILQAANFDGVVDPGPRATNALRRALARRHGLRDGLSRRSAPPAAPGTRRRDPGMSLWADDAALFAAVRRELFVAVVGDVLDRLGVQKQFLSPDLKPIDPASVVLGRAMPVLEADFFAERASGQAAISGQPFGLMFAALDDLKPGEVYICAGASHRYALWGGLMSTRARLCGATGAVLHGFHRDTNEILRLGFPVASFGSYAQDQGPRGKVVDWRVPIELDGVRVEPGDVVYGDRDGVLVVPKALVEPAFAGAFEKVRGESAVLTALEGGMSTAEAFAKFGIM